MEVDPKLEKVIHSYLELEKNKEIGQAPNPINDEKDPMHIDKNGCINCACGEKRIPTQECRVFTTDANVSVIDRTCDECKPNVKGMCAIVCTKCKDVVAYVAPGKSDSGFVMEAGKTYHVDRCPQCDPESFKGRTVKQLTIEEYLYLTEQGKQVDMFSKE